MLHVKHYMFHGRVDGMKPPCSNCRKRKRRASDQRYCKKCHNAYQREWRPDYKDLTDEQKKKIIARSMANVYQSRGKLKRRSFCEICRKRRVLEKHHDDYSKALEVRWLCGPCHKNV